MGQILLLEDVMKEVLSSNEEFTLFGKRDYIQTADGLYDFVFHSIEGIPLDRLRDEPLLVIPLIRFKYPEDYNPSLAQIHHIHQKNPAIDRFAMRDNRISLKFFAAKRVPSGTAVGSIDTYTVTNHKESEKLFSQWSRVRKYIERLKERIRGKYLIQVV